MPKVMANLKNGISSNFIQEIKKIGKTEFTLVYFKLSSEKVENFRILNYDSVWRIRKLLVSWKKKPENHHLDF